MQLSSTATLTPIHSPSPDKRITDQHFNGRPGTEPRWNHKDRSARPVRAAHALFVHLACWIQLNSRAAPDAGYIIEGVEAFWILYWSFVSKRSKKYVPSTSSSMN